MATLEFLFRVCNSALYLSLTFDIRPALPWYDHQLSVQVLHCVVEKSSPLTFAGVTCPPEHVNLFKEGFLLRVQETSIVVSADSIRTPKKVELQFLILPALPRNCAEIIPIDCPGI